MLLVVAANIVLCQVHSGNNSVEGMFIYYTVYGVVLPWVNWEIGTWALSCKHGVSYLPTGPAKCSLVSMCTYSCM